MSCLPTWLSVDPCDPTGECELGVKRDALFAKFAPNTGEPGFAFLGHSKDAPVRAIVKVGHATHDDPFHFRLILVIKPDVGCPSLGQEDKVRVGHPITELENQGLFLMAEIGRRDED